MNLMRQLFEQSRISGKIELKELFMRDCLPIVYIGDSTEGFTYYNSGGRSIVIERDGYAYKITGVDPEGYLTRKVAASESNHLRDVRIAAECFEAQSCLPSHQRTYKRKPFGVLTYNNFENAKTAFELLNRIYQMSGLEPPCTVVTHKTLGFKVASEDAYQILFELPRAESDLRVHEFSEILIKKLAKASQEELKKKMKYVNRIFGRFVGWAGYSAGVLAINGLLPYETSWHAQNYVIHNIGNGYGAFRVDHTSTMNVGQENAVQKLKEWIDNAFKGGPMINPIVEFTFVPEVTQIAALYPELTEALPVDKSLTPFERVLEYYKSTEGTMAKSIANIDALAEAHLKSFGTGLNLCKDHNAKELAIPEEYFEAVFE